MTMRLLSLSGIYLVLMEGLKSLLNSFITKEHIDTCSCCQWNISRSLCTNILILCCPPVRCISFSTCRYTIYLPMGLIQLSNLVSLKVSWCMFPSTLDYNEIPKLRKERASSNLFPCVQCLGTNSLKPTYLIFKPRHHCEILPQNWGI